MIPDKIKTAMVLPLWPLVVAAAFPIAWALSREIDRMMARSRKHEAKSNHADFHGTWTPEEVALNAWIRRESEGLHNHSRAEGTPQVNIA